jgi:hypothetical protein
MVKPLISGLLSANSTALGLGSADNVTALASLSKMNELHTITQKVEWKTNYLMKLKEQIEELPLFHQIEILRILNSKHINLNENKNGIFINITKLSDATLTELEDYMKYVSKQEEQLKEIEQQKDNITKEFFESKK